MDNVSQPVVSKVLSYGPLCEFSYQNTCHLSHVMLGRLWRGFNCPKNQHVVVARDLMAGCEVDDTKGSAVSRIYSSVMYSSWC